MPAFSNASSNTAPAGPTNGLPARSSWSPGCSPTNIIRAERGPAPNTVCSASAYSRQPRHPLAAAASLVMLRVSGTNGAAPTVVSTENDYPSPRLLNHDVAASKDTAEAAPALILPADGYLRPV